MEREWKLSLFANACSHHNRHQCIREKRASATDSSNSSIAVFCLRYFPAIPLPLAPPLPLLLMQQASIPCCFPTLSPIPSILSPPAGCLHPSAAKLKSGMCVFSLFPFPFPILFSSPSFKVIRETISEVEMWLHNTNTTNP